MEFIIGFFVGSVVTYAIFCFYKEHLLNRAAMEGTEEINGNLVTLLWEEEYIRLKEAEKRSLSFKEKS